MCKAHVELGAQTPPPFPKIFVSKTLAQRCITQMVKRRRMDIMFNYNTWTRKLILVGFFQDNLLSSEHFCLFLQFKSGFQQKQ